MTVPALSVVPRDAFEDLLASAMTDYVLIAGRGQSAPAIGVAEHVASYLATRGYHLARTDQH